MFVDSETITSEDAFRFKFPELAGAAFGYSYESSELAGHPWAFGEAIVAPQDRATVRFVHVTPTGTTATMWLSIMSDRAGAWSILPL